MQAQGLWDTPPVGQPVPGYKSVCPGATGPVWRLREPLDDDSVLVDVTLPGGEVLHA